MTRHLFSAIPSTVLLASSTLAHASCNPALTEQFAGMQRIVDSLRPDKPGQMRVLASDGSEYTAGEVQWMKGQLRLALRSCAQGDEASAASALHGVVELLNARHRGLSSSGAP